MSVVTIAREYGAGGSELAKALGARLGWPVLDHDLTKRVAARLEFDPAVVERMDEHAPSLFARLASAMVVYPPESPVMLQPPLPSADAIAQAVREEILEAAASPPLIVVGHGAQCILRGHPDALHVRLVGPIADRARRVVGRDGCNSRDAADQVRRVDDERSGYIRRYHQCDWRDPLLYDLNINTGRLSVVEATELIVALVNARARAAAG
jgi:cytidylate kinase